MSAPARPSQAITNLRSLTPNQVDRLVAGVLPEDELLTAARAELFEPFDGQTRWAGDKRTTELRQGLRHKDSCRQPRALGGPPVVDEEHVNLDTMTATEWESWRVNCCAAALALQHPALEPGAVTVEKFRHRVRCATCERVREAASAKVSITWNGRTLVREYALS